MSLKDITEQAIHCLSYDNNENSLLKSDDKKMICITETCSTTKNAKSDLFRLTLKYSEIRLPPAIPIDNSRGKYHTKYVGIVKHHNLIGKRAASNT